MQQKRGILCRNFAKEFHWYFYQDGGWDESIQYCTRNEERKESRTALLKVSVLKLK
jgi:hypothetical protein